MPVRLLKANYPQEARPVAARNRATLKKRMRKRTIPPLSVTFAWTRPRMRLFQCVVTCSVGHVSTNGSVSSREMLKLFFEHSSKSLFLRDANVAPTVPRLQSRHLKRQGSSFVWPGWGPRGSQI
jgi:hypothetical protein